MTLTDLSDQTYRDLGKPQNLSIPEIAYWYRYNVGTLNIQIHMAYALTDDITDFNPQLGIAEANIFKILYFIKYANSNYLANLGATAYDWSELDEGDTRVRRVSKNEIAKSFKMMRDAFTEDLNHLVYLYKKNQVLPVGYTYEGGPWLALMLENMWQVGG